MTHQMALHGAIMDAATDAIIVIDAASVVIEANAAARTMFGFEGGSLVGTPLRELQAPESRTRHADAVGRYLATGQRSVSWQGATVLARHRTGREFPVEISFGEFTERGERRFVGIIRDVSERTRIERQLHQARKMEALGLLAGGIAHDFNNLLTAIMGYTDLAEDGVEPGHPARGDLCEIRGAASRASAMTKQLLAFSRSESIEPSVFEPGTTLLAMEPLLRQLVGSRVELQVEVPVEPYAVRMDPTHFDQVLINLTANARDAMLGGGTLTVRIGDPSNAPVLATDQARADGGRWLRLTVTDTGSGMSADILEHIFDPFFTTKEVGYGTGLGLATVHSVVQQAGGSISAVSRPGAGSTFAILLPVYERHLTSQPVITATGRLHETSTVLVVIDAVTSVAAAAALTLRRSGCAVLTAVDGPAAVHLAAATSCVDVLVLGVTVRDAMGASIARAVMRHHPNVSIIYLAEPSGGPRIKVDPGDPTGEVLVMPLAVQDVVGAVRRVLEARGQTSTTPPPAG